MAHIVFTISALTSRINASFELARRLHSRGHRITYVTYTTLENSVREKGFDFVGIPWGRSLFTDTEYQSFKARPYWQKLLNFSEVLRQRRKIIDRFITNTSLHDAIQRLKPDLLLIDLEMQAYVISTWHFRIPTLLFFEMFSVWKMPGVPPLDSSYLPGKRWYDRVVVEWLWLCWGVERSYDAMHSKISRFGIDWLSVLKILARHRKFPFHSEADCRQWLTPFVFRSIPVITTNVLEMEFSSNPPKNVHYVGPLIPDARNQRQAYEDFDSIFDRLVRRRQDEGRTRPLIYCSTSTYVQVDHDFLRNVIQVFEIKKEWDVILGLGKKLQIQQLGRIPSNVFAFDWAPQLRVLEHADAAIIHGGTTSINECVYFGVPMMVYSTKTMDHNGNAARVAYHGLGIVADKDTDKVEDMIQNIETVLHNRQIKTNVLNMREVFRSYEKANHAVSFVENFIKQHMDDTQC